MFELSIITSAEKQNYIIKLNANLLDEIKRDSGISAIEINKGRCFYSIAIKKDKKEYYKSKILDYIIFMIIDDYKFNFYKNALIVNSKNIMIESFLKAISIFDAEIDSAIIKREIDLSKTIVVDSFYYFKLQGLRSRWRKTAQIINGNQILNSNDSMIDVLKYLTTMSNNKTDELKLIISKEKLEIKNLSQKLIFQRDFQGNSSFLTEIVSLNPSKLCVELKSNDDKVYEILDKIFYEKIYIIN